MTESCTHPVDALRPRGSCRGRRQWRCTDCGRVLTADARTGRPAVHRRQPGHAAGHTRRDSRGRWCVYLGPSHPYANSGGWQYRSRLTCAVALGRMLRSDEHVHHVDGDRSNDALHNLEVLSVEYHGRLHASAMEVAGVMKRDAKGRYAGRSEAQRVAADPSGDGPDEVRAFTEWLDAVRTPFAVPWVPVSSLERRPVNAAHADGSAIAEAEGPARAEADERCMSTWGEHHTPAAPFNWPRDKAVLGPAARETR